MIGRGPVQKKRGPPRSARGTCCFRIRRKAPPGGAPIQEKGGGNLPPPLLYLTFSEYEAPLFRILMLSGENSAGSAAMSAAFLRRSFAVRGSIGCAAFPPAEIAYRHKIVCFFAIRPLIAAVFRYGRTTLADEEELSYWSITSCMAASSASYAVSSERRVTASMS